MDEEEGLDTGAQWQWWKTSRYLVASIQRRMGIKGKRRRDGIINKSDKR